MTYKITFFNPDSEEGEEKTWMFETLRAAYEWRKILSEFWEITENEILIEETEKMPRLRGI